MEGDRRLPADALDPRARLLALLGFVVAVVATSPRALWPFLSHALVLAFFVGYSRVSAGTLARRLLFLAPLLLAVVGARALWLLLRQDPGEAAVQAELWLVALLGVRSGLSVLAVAAFMGRGEINQLTQGLRGLGVPAVLAGVMEQANRYRHLLWRELGLLRDAAGARGFRPRHLGDTVVLGQLTGSLMLRSLQRSERVHQAMLSRGFTGILPASRPLRWSGRDMLFLLMALALPTAISAASYLVR